MSISKNLAEYRKQYKEKEAVFYNETAELNKQIKSCVDEIKQKFMQFENDLLGRLCTDDFYFTMRWGVEEDDGTEKDYAALVIGYKDERTTAPCNIDVPIEKIDEIETFEDLKQYSDTYFFPSFWDSPSLNERAMQEELQSSYEDLMMGNYDFEYGDVKY